MMGPEVVGGLIEIIVTGCILLAIWKFIDRMDPESDHDKKH